MRSASSRRRRAAERIALRRAFVVASGRSWPDAPGVGNVPGAIVTVRDALRSPLHGQGLWSSRGWPTSPPPRHAKGVSGMVEVERMEEEATSSPLAPIQCSSRSERANIVPCSVGARNSHPPRETTVFGCATKVAAASSTSTSSGASRDNRLDHGITAAPSRRSHRIGRNLAARVAAHPSGRRFQEFEPSGRRRRARRQAPGSGAPSRRQARSRLR